MEKITCGQCNQDILRNHTSILELETKQYCSIECLSTFCEEHFVNCSFCKLQVQSSVKIKFCLRFGTKVEQFCSSSCIENFKKKNSFCKLCHEPIRSFMLISDEKEFCSPFCIARYNGLGINQLKFENVNCCRVCGADGVHHLELLKDVQSLFFCSKFCVRKYNQIHGTIKYICTLCGCLIENYAAGFYQDNKFHKFCSYQCFGIFLSYESDVTPCSICQMEKLSHDLIKRNGESKSDWFCSLPCLKKGQESSLANEKLPAPDQRNDCTSTSAQTCSAKDNTRDKKNGQILNVVLKNCHARDLLTKIIKSHLLKTVEDKCVQASVAEADTSQHKYVQTLLDEAALTNTKLRRSSCANQESQTEDTSGPIVIPFPVYIPKPIPQFSAFQTTPMVIPVPIPIPIPIPLLKGKEKIANIEKKLTFSDVAKQFILKAVNKIGDEVSPNDSVEDIVDKNWETSSLELIISTAIEEENGSSDDFVALTDGEECEIISVDGITSAQTKEKCGQPSSAQMTATPRILGEFIDPVATSSNTDFKIISTDPKDKNECEKPSMDPGALAAKIECDILFSNLSTSSFEQSKNTSSDLVAAPIRNNDINPTKKSVASSAKKESKNPSSNSIAATVKETDCIMLSSDSEELSVFDLNWSSDSDIMEFEAPTESNKKMLDNEATVDMNTSSDSQYLSKLIKDCDITKSTIKLRETLGTKVWNEYVAKKLKNSEFRRKVSARGSELDELSLADKTTFLVAFLKDFPSESNIRYTDLIYILLCLQKHFSSNCVVDSLFFNPSYQRFGKLFFSYLHDLMDKFFNLKYFYDSFKDLQAVRIREEMLWDAFQLGSMSPHVLLFTMLYFNTKNFLLHSVKEHENVWMKNFSSYRLNTSDTTSKPIKCLRYNYPKCKDSHNRNFKEIVEDEKNEWRCHVKLSEFYNSKCPPITLRTASYYFFPVLDCTPETKIWFTTRRLPTELLRRMFHLTLMVEEIQNVLAKDKI